MELLNKFLDYLIHERKLALSTVHVYQLALAVFEDYCIAQSKDVLSMNANDISLYLNYLSSEKKYSPRTLCLRLSTLRTYYNFLHFRGYYQQKNPCALLKSPKIERLLPVVINRDSAIRLLSMPDVNDIHGLRDRVVLELLYSCGLRISEVERVLTRDISISKRELRVYGKGSLERYVPFCQNTCDIFELWKNEITRLSLNQFVDRFIIAIPFYSKPKPLSPRYVRLLLMRYALEADIELRVTPHTLRRSIATHLLESGLTIREVSTFLGHSDISTTEQYIGLSDGRLHDSIDRMHPLSRKHVESNIINIESKLKNL